MPTYRVHWRNARSVYSSVRTTTVEAADLHDVERAVLATGHYEERTPDAVVILGALRRFVVEHPRYASGSRTNELAAPHLAPWEKLAYVPNDGNHWGADHTVYYAQAVYPSTQWCVDCGISTQRGPWAVGHVTRDGYSRTYCRNVVDHQGAHEIADSLLANGSKSAGVFLDTCG